MAEMQRLEKAMKDSETETRTLEESINEISSAIENYEQAKERVLGRLGVFN